MSEMKVDFWRVDGGSADSVFWVEIYGGHSDETWFKWTIQPIYQLARRVDRLMWWVRYRFSREHRYHLVDTGLEPGYWDVDELMLRACFALLCRYVEDEMGGAEAIERFNQQLLLTPDPNGPEGLQESQAGRQGEAVQLYRWWKVTKPADEKRREEMMHHLFGRKRSVRPAPDGIGMVWSSDEPWTAADREMYREFRALEEKIDADEQAMLHRLIEIRRSLWT